MLHCEWHEAHGCLYAVWYSDDLLIEDDEPEQDGSLLVQDDDQPF